MPSFKQLLRSLALATALAASGLATVNNALAEERKQEQQAVDQLKETENAKAARELKARLVKFMKNTDDLGRAGEVLDATKAYLGVLDGKYRSKTNQDEFVPLESFFDPAKRSALNEDIREVRELLRLFKRHNAVLRKVLGDIFLVLRLQLGMIAENLEVLEATVAYLKESKPFNESIDNMLKNEDAGDEPPEEDIERT